MVTCDVSVVEQPGDSTTVPNTRYLHTSDVESTLTESEPQRGSVGVVKVSGPRGSTKLTVPTEGEVKNGRPVYREIGVGKRATERRHE